MKTLLFDVCHTLYQANTTYDFLAFYFADDARFAGLLKKRRSLWARLFARLTGHDPYRQKAIAYLQGEPEEQLQARAKSFVKTLVPIEPTQAMLREAQANGDRVVLVSASLDLVVSEVAAELGVNEYHASKLAFANGVCQGHLLLDLLGNKTSVVNRSKGANPALMVSDNFSDAGCIDLVDEFHPVYRRGDAKAQRFWQSKRVASAICYE